jgi:hypothetical protein
MSRRRVPALLAERLGQCEVHRSLQTSSKRQATVRARRARRALVATDTAFRTLSHNPHLLAANAKTMIAQLLDKSILDSPTADELVRSVSSADCNYHKPLFSHEAVPIVAALPAPQLEKMELHLDRIATRAELALSRAQLERERRRVDLLLGCAKVAMARADEAEAQIARTTVIQAVTPQMQVSLIAPYPTTTRRPPWRIAQARHQLRQPYRHLPRVRRLVEKGRRNSPKSKDPS